MPIPPKRYATELSEQCRLIEWTKWQTLPNGLKVWDLLFAIPNGAALTHQINDEGRKWSSEAVRLKKSGLKNGVPDLMLAYPSGPYHGLFIEMKRAKKSLSRVSDEQKVMLERLNAQGYLAVVAYGAEAAQGIIVDYLRGSYFDRGGTGQDAAII